MTARLAASPTAAAVSPFAGADVCTLANLPVISGRHGPVFDDDVWDFRVVEGLPVQAKGHTLRWDLTRISKPAWRQVAKEYLLALLAPGHEAVRLLPHAYRVPRTLRTCRARLDELMLWFGWLTSQNVTSLAQVDQEHCDAYIEHRRWRRDGAGQPIAQRAKSTTGAGYAVLIDLAQYRELFTADRYQPGFRPWKGRTAAIAGGRTRFGENRTQPAPLEMLQPLLAAALYVVDHLGEHIVELDRHRRDHARRPARPYSPRADGPEPILTAIRQHVAENQPFVATAPALQVRGGPATGRSEEDPLLPVSLLALAQEAGQHRFDPKWLPAIRGELTDAVAVVGAQPRWGRGAAPVARADDGGETAWTLPLFGRDVLDLTSFARTACLAVTAAVSGMRASELMELRRGCSSRVEHAPGVTRYWVTSKLVKDQPLGGTVEQWLVIEPVHRALTLAGQLANDPAADALLFGRFDYQPLYQAFRRWVNGPAGQRLGLAPIPPGPLNVRMLRRRLAVELAYRPGGLLAAKIHLKHVSVATTEGYAARPGGAQAKLLAEVAAEEDQRNLDLVARAYEDYRHGIRPAGPGARDLMNFFDSVDGQLNLAEAGAPNLVPEQTVRTLLGKRAKTLYLGTANYCWFADPSKALCLKLADTPTAAMPLAGMCDSTRCPQASHHPCHRPVWEEQARTTSALITGLSRRQNAERARLQIELARIQQVIDDIDTAQKPARADEVEQR